MANKVKTFSYKREAAQNPYIGFTSFQHFRNDELYSDLVVKPENNMTETEHVECYPVPDYVEEKGRAQGYYPDTSIVYIRILWKEFEPEQGKYNYAFIDDILRKAEENNQLVMFRLMPHSTRETDDVPDWLKKIIDCPARPLGQRIKTSPSSPDFLKYFGEAVKKFGERYDSNPTLDTVDVSLPGSWGEGSSIELFTEEQIKEFADIYTAYYKNTTLIGQIIAPWLVHYMNEKKPVGWRADCIGHEGIMTRHVKVNEAQMPEIWKTAPVSFESYWWLGEWQRKEWNLDWIIQTTLDWHISSFNAKSLPIPWEWKDKIDAWVDKMGYHFVIDSFACPMQVQAGKTLETELCVDNVGVAPIYNERALVLRLTSATKTYAFKTAVDLRKWLPGKHTETLCVTLPEGMEKGKYAVEIGICEEGKPTVYFASDAPLCDGFYTVGETEVK